MPRKAKEKIEELNNIENTENVTKVATKKKTKTESKSSTKKTATVKESKIASKPEKAIKSKVAKKDTETNEKKSTAKTSKAKATTKSTSKSKATAKTKPTSKSKSSTKAKSKTSTKVSPVVDTEYYDLPFRYNQTVVRILAQTPNTLFIYWDISDEDRNSYVQKYGKDFFNHTRPYLIITNETMHYSFEVEINDFANSWYLHINDADCEYKVELGRKFIVNSEESNSSKDTQDNLESYQANDYLYITSSNELEMPNNQILFDKLGSSVFFRNTKTNIMEKKDISSISFLQKIGKVYNIYDLYKEIYQDELISDEFGLNLPSSSSSSFK